MSQVSLNEVREAFDKAINIFSAYEAANEPRFIDITASRIELKAGEEYVGEVLGEDGTLSHRLILLPEEVDEINYADALEWAEKLGGSLPTRQEQALLFANQKSQFKSEWYWSAEQHADGANSAWCQYVGDGEQDTSHKDNKLRARAVRRLAI